MRSGQIDVTGDNLRTRTDATLGAEHGTLQGISAYITSAGSTQLSSFVEVGLKAPGDLPHSRLVVLASGYISQNSSITWTGAVGLGPTWELYISLWSSDSATARVSSITVE